MYKIFIIGISESQLSESQYNLLEKSVLLVATDRLLAITSDFSGKTLPITPLGQAISTIRTTLSTGNVAVLASGDPLFYGIGRKLLTEFSAKQIEIFPAVSSMQRACALFKIPWDDAAIVSLHGRKQHHTPGMLLRNNTTIVFTDQHQSPKTIAANLLDYLQCIDYSSFSDKITISVAEEIGLEGETLFSGTLVDAAERDFSPLNVLCLQLPDLQSQGLLPFGFGLTENEISHSRGLITKNEVRAISLHYLRLPRQGIFWDIGGGSGSLSIEAGRSNPCLTIYTVEHKEEELDNIKENIRRYGCFNVVPVFGRAPEILKTLPAPDRVFIGGSSGSLDKIVHLVAGNLAVDGCLVINGIIEKTIRTAPQYMRQHGFSVTQSMIKISRKSIQGETQNYNPITVMAGTR
jgi:precorrin-6Y C5,15-methyltransferase (decarboxylating)